MVVVIILLTMLMLTMMFFYDDFEEDDDDDDFEDDDEGDFEDEYDDDDEILVLRSGTLLLCSRCRRDQSIGKVCLIFHTIFHFSHYLKYHPATRIQPR